jgi:hypothetical protein
LRYYKIVITNPAGKVTNTYTSFVNGMTDLGALDIELDISVAPYASPYPNRSFIKIWGIPLQSISQSQNLNGSTIQVFGGMQKGLPLANPAQAGLLVTGTILQAFSNWVGLDQTLDFVLGSPVGSNKSPMNIILNWKAGTPINVAIQNSLNASFPGYTITSNVKQGIVTAHDEVGYFASLDQFAMKMRELSIAIVGGTSEYNGVDIVLKEKAFAVYDGTTANTPKQIAFTDLIGQPTWLDPQHIQFITVMRADISLNDYIKLPPTPITTTAANLSQYRDSSVFQGIFPVRNIRHVGRFRQADAGSWLTVFDGFGDGSGKSGG